VVILAVDVKINGEERFQGKPIVRVKTEVVIKSPVKFLEKVGGFTGACLRRSS
jgi:Phosphotransferase system fructose-specific component IIB